MPQWDERRCSRSPQMPAIEYVQMYLVLVKRSINSSTTWLSPTVRETRVSVSPCHLPTKWFS